MSDNKNGESDQQEIQPIVDPQLRPIENDYLKFLYKKYTDYIIHFEKHVSVIYNDMIINIFDRNIILQELNIMVREMIKIFNNSLLKNYRESDIETKPQLPIHHKPSMKKMIYDHLYIIENIENQNIDPFITIKDKLITLGKLYGFYSIDNFLKLYVSEQYNNILNETNNEIIDIYSKVFVPINITIKKIIMPNENITIKKLPSNHDSLIDNMCMITIYFSHIETQIIFSGYVTPDVLNIYVRTSQIYSKYIFRAKKEFEQHVKNKYHDIDPIFYSKYIKMVNGYIYFINSPSKNAKLFKESHDFYMSLSTKGTNNIIKLFLQSDIKSMFNIINLLLMGHDKMIYVATSLFDSLQDKKNHNYITRDIIYRNLSFNAQNKLTIVSSDIKSEISKIKSLTIENISIEKKIAIMVDMPDNVKSYIMEKTQEIKSGENNYKLQTAINGLMNFPWKPKNFKNEYDEIRSSMTKSRTYLQEVSTKLDHAVYGHENFKKH